MSTAFDEPVREALIHPMNLLVWVLQMLYNLAQTVIIALFKPVSYYGHLLKTYL